MASNPNYCDITPEIEALAAQSLQNSSIDAGDYVRYDVKRGLRDLNGKGVLAGYPVVFLKSTLYFGLSLIHI